MPELTPTQQAIRQREIAAIVERIVGPGRKTAQRLDDLEQIVLFLAGLAPLVDRVRHLEFALSRVEIPAGGLELWGSTK